ncbi:MAG: hypothetical protein GC165_18615 [Armatimonadetes bacterium]|nr:hypothetical protein [Armatimonadota bacterium]
MISNVSSPSQHRLQIVKSALATLGVAALANACCWVPPLLLAVGGTGARFAKVLDPYRPYLLAFMVVQLVWGFRNAYRSHKGCCGEDDKHARRVRIITMWIIAIIVIALNLIPHHH